MTMIEEEGQKFILFGDVNYAIYPLYICIGTWHMGRYGALSMHQNHSPQN